MKNYEKKICYILPKFDLETDTHYLHLFDFINSAAQELDMTLIIENSKSDIKYFDNIKQVYVQKFKWLPVRILENLWLVLKLRLQGYKKFYVHYTFIGAVNAGIVTRLLGGTTWYWHCGMVWLFGKHRVLKIVLHIVQYHVTGNNTMKIDYAKHFSLSDNKTVVMPNWVDKKRFGNFDIDSIKKKYNINNTKQYVLFVHHLSKRKGANHIVPTAKNFKNNPNVEFLIAGDGDYMPILKQEIDEENLHNVRLLGRVPNKDVPALLQLASVFFMPSEEEGFPRVIIEAMMTGTPYVASDIGGTKEISAPEQYRYICQVGDIECLSNGISKLLDDQVEVAKLVKVNKKWVERYEKDVVLKKFINLFNEK